MVNSSTFRWDKAGEKYTFETMLEVLKARMEKSKTDKEYTYYAILLTQLVNGARVGEAVNGFFEFVKTGKRELRIRVEKQRKEKYRLFIIPPIINYERVVWLEKEKPRKIIPRVKMFIKKKLDLNSHSLRYLFISYMARRGVSAQEIAKITGHENLNHILHYTRKIEAEDRFKEIVGEVFDVKRVG
ncbi:MAG: tyrosine-type recombinase/integrase [Thermofilum sp.]|jgi:integrase|uniref:tyrosine-type recombinase/integrase n=1 Tax=Thermofilum sp. TaxID=1961369 RepID=UPI002585C6BC|nr:tyrosine-type recombinase/integrase [Thermofilum sp.]MCI4408479.1 tyrosine-type recombinase/integrase [Thermofilum sp.]